MPKFEVRTYEENIFVTADSVEYCADGIRLMFKAGEKVIAGFSRYLWVKELPEATVSPAPQTELTPEPAPESQPE